MTKEGLRRAEKLEREMNEIQERVNTLTYVLSNQLPLNENIDTSYKSAIALFGDKDLVVAVDRPMLRDFLVLLREKEWKELAEKEKEFSEL